MKTGPSQTQRLEDQENEFYIHSYLYELREALCKALKEDNVLTFQQYLKNFSAEWVYFIWLFLESKKHKNAVFAKMLLEHYPMLGTLSESHQWISLDDPTNFAPKAALTKCVESNDTNALTDWLNNFSTDWIALDSFLVTARDNKQIEIICLLIDRYPQFINCILHDKRRKRSILHWAASHGYIKIIEVALHHKIDLEQRDELNFETPLVIAAHGKHIEIVALLLQHGANVNARNHNATALHWAVSGGNVLLVKLLLENGAKPFYGSVSGKKGGPIDIAKECRSIWRDREKEYDEIIALLEAYFLKQPEKGHEKFEPRLEEQEETSSEEQIDLSEFFSDYIFHEPSSPPLIFSQQGTSIVSNDAPLVIVEEAECVEEKQKIAIFY